MKKLYKNKAMAIMLPRKPEPVVAVSRKTAITKLVLGIVLCFTVVILMIMCCAPKLVVYSDEGRANDSFTDQLDNIDLTPFEDFLGEETTFGDESFKDKVSDLLQGKPVDGESIFTSVIQIVFKSLTDLIPLFSVLIGMTLLFGVLTHMKNGFLSEEIQGILNMCLMLSIMLVVMGSVINLIVEAKTVMISLKNQMFTAFPILLTLMFASGGKTSVVAFQPILYFLSVIISDVIVKAVFPIFIFSLVISLMSAVSPQMKMKKMSDFLKSSSIYIIGITLTVFTATLAISGVASGTYDSVLYRTAKYAVGHSVPVIGGYIRDGLDVVIMSSVMIKNSVGIVAMILFMMTVLSPIITVFGFSLMLKLVAGISDGFCDPEVSNFFVSVSSHISLIGVSLLAVTFMYLISVLALIATANMGV